MLSAELLTRLTRHYCSSLVSLEVLVLVLVFVSRVPGFTVYCACSSPVSPEVLMPVIILTFAIILILILILVFRTFLSLLLVV